MALGFYGRRQRRIKALMPDFFLQALFIVDLNKPSRQTPV